MTHSAKSSVGWTHGLRTALPIVLFMAFGSPRAAVMNGCMEDLYNEFGQGGSLNCTANDIQIASVTDVQITDDGCAFPGDTVTFNAKFEVLLTAQTRYDIGIYLAQDGGDALNGSCLVDVLPFEPNNEDCTAAATPYACCTSAGMGTCEFLDEDGTTNDTTPSDDFGYCSPDSGTTLSNPIQACNEDSDCSGGDTCEEFSGVQDTCGEIVDNQDPRNPVLHTISGITAVCTDTDRNGLLDVAACTSWRQPGANQLCLTPLAAFPGAPSKCRCDEALEIPIVVPQTIEVVKILDPDTDPGRFNLEIDGNQEAGDVGDGGTTGPVMVSPVPCAGGDCLCSLGGDECASDADCSASVCTESVTNQGNPLSCTSDADCGTEGTCAETQQGNSPKPCADDGDCDTGDECLKSPTDVCLIDTCRDFSHTVSESGSGTDLNAYEITIDCVDRVGRCAQDATTSCVTDTICDAANAGDVCDPTPTPIAQCSGCTTIQVNVPAPSDVLCTITNTPKCADVDCDDGVSCTIDACDPVTGQCSNLPSDSLCDDGMFCNGFETCDPTDDCQAGTPPVCDDGVDCTIDSCDEANDDCVQTPDDSICDDGMFCNGVETCDPTDDCQAGTPPVCDDGVDCTIDSCDEANDICVQMPTDSLCDDGMFCNGVETCDPTGDCQAGTPPVCDDGVDCTIDSCDEANDTCVQTPDDSICDDDLFCNGVETCDPTDDCQAGTPPVCDDGVDCTIDSCDEANDVCVQTPDDSICDDGMFCNGVEICDPTDECQAGTPPVCDDSDVCTDDVCDEDLDVCVNDPNDECPMDCLTMRLTLNATDFVPGGELVLELDFIPDGVSLDLHVQWLAPDGAVLYLAPDGSLTSDPVPYLANWEPDTLIAEVVLTRVFTGSDPLGTYLVRGFATLPESSLQITRSDALSFTLSN